MTIFQYIQCLCGPGANTKTGLTGFRPLMFTRPLQSGILQSGCEFVLLVLFFLTVAVLNVAIINLNKRVDSSFFNLRKRRNEPHVR